MTKYRMMVVDDDQEIAQLVSRIATDCGFEVKTASGAQVMTLYPSFLPCAVVLDVMMPDVDGIEVLQYLKDQHPCLHVIILSGSPDTYRHITHNLGKAVGFVVQASITKPFRVQELRSAFLRIIDSMEGANSENRSAV